MGNSFFNEYPYTDFHELNLSWVIKELRSFATTLEQFVSINALKYADPIQWNITSQYEKNTIVIEPQTGSAYISVQPVPAGVIITNTDYWTIVFDLNRLLVKSAQNFTNHYESELTLTATFPSQVNDWLVWGEELYTVISPIIAGDQYVVDSNIKRFNMEGLIGHIEDLSTSTKTSIVDAINEIFDICNDIETNIIGDLANLSTSDKTSVVNAINEIFAICDNIESNIIGDLANLSTSDKTSVVNAVNEVFAICNDIETIIIGDLANLTTTDKSSVVNAINELDGDIGDLNDLTTSDKTSIVNSINSIRASVIAGKKVVFYGDSITQGLLNTVPEFANPSWPETFGNVTGAIVENRAINGSSFVAIDANSFANRYLTEDFSNIDILVLNYGINDTTNPANKTRLDFYTDFNTVISAITSAYPSMEIWWVLEPISTFRYNVYGAGYTVDQMYDLIRQLCAKYNIPVIDLSIDGSFNQVNMLNNTISWDGVHLTQHGYDLMGQRAAEVMFNQSIHNNVTCWQEVIDTEGNAGNKTISINLSPNNAPIKGVLIVGCVKNEVGHGIFMSSDYLFANETLWGYSINIFGNDGKSHIGTNDLILVDENAHTATLGLVKYKGSTLECWANWTAGFTNELQLDFMIFS